VVVCQMNRFPKRHYFVFFLNEKKYCQMGTDFPKIRHHVIDIFWKLNDQNTDDCNVYSKSLNKHMVSNGALICFWHMV